MLEMFLSKTWTNHGLVQEQVPLIQYLGLMLEFFLVEMLAFLCLSWTC